MTEEKKYFEDRLRNITLNILQKYVDDGTIKDVSTFSKVKEGEYVVYFSFSNLHIPDRNALRITTRVEVLLDFIIGAFNTKFASGKALEFSEELYKKVNKETALCRFGLNKA